MNELKPVSDETIVLNPQTTCIPISDKPADNVVYSNYVNSNYYFIIIIIHKVNGYRFIFETFQKF